MSNTHVSVDVINLLKMIRTLDGALDSKNRTTLDSLYNECETLFKEIKKQGREDNEDLSSYVNILDQADIDLSRLKKGIKEKRKTVFEAVSAFIL